MFPRFTLPLRKPCASGLSSTLNFRSFSNANSNSQLNLTRLDNGLRVTTEERAGNLAIVGLTLEAGTSHQTKNNGVANLMKKVLLTSYQSLTLHSLSVGQTNAYTTRDRTVLTTTCLKDEVPRAVEQLGAVISNLGVMEQVILARLNRTQTELDPEGILSEHLYSIAFQNHPLSYSRDGTEEAQFGDYFQFVEENVTGPRVILAGVGVLHEDLVELGKTHFSSLSTSSGQPRTNPRYVGSKVDIRDDYLEKVHISYAVSAPPITSDSYLAGRVIQAILGQWESSHGISSNSTSRLAETVALEHLGEKVKAFYDAYHTAGLLGVHTITSPHEVEDFSVEVLTEFVRISQKVSRAEVERGQRRVRHELLSSVASAPALFDTISQQVFYHGKRTPVQDLVTKVEALTQPDVRKVAEEILYDVDPVIAAYGQTTHLPDYNRLRSWIYWNRL